MVTAQCVKDSFQYSFNLSEETLDIQGVSVEIWHDKDVSNPYLDYDGMAPALWLHPQRYGGRIDDFGGYDLERFFGSVSPAWVSRHWRAIAAILDLTESDVDSDCHDMLANHGGGMSETRREYFSERLYEMKATTWGRRNGLSRSLGVPLPAGRCCGGYVRSHGILSRRRGVRAYRASARMAGKSRLPGA
jgi:hypothetical protein